MNIPQTHHQQGATLLISLVLLLIITLLGVSSIRGVALEERIVGNLRDKQTASDGAEAALREGENRLALSVGPATATGACSGTDLCLLATPPANISSDDWSWWTTAGNSTPYTGSTTDNTALYGIITPALWQAALLGYDPMNSKGTVEVTDTEERSRGIGPYFYQISSSSRGRTARMMVSLQSTTVQRY